MVQNNKVLTVSYGTFSCTLEGFDDSFETMKAIAEYFRDLAAEDRYFGSEPPQPDAEMLARIAQRDASTRVEARQNESGLLLRATEVAAAPSEPATPVEQALSAAEPEQAPAVFFDDAEEVENAPAPAADSIAAKLQRIRAVVSHTDENSVIYAEDEETTLMREAAGPSDAVAAAFEAGSLSAEDLQEDVSTEDVAQADAAPFEAENTAPIAEDDHMPTAEAAPEAVEPVAELDEPVEEYDPSIEAVIEAVEDLEETPVLPTEDVIEEEIAETEIQLSDDEQDKDEEILNILSEDASDDGELEVEETAAEEGVLSAQDEENLLSEISEVEAFLANRANEPAADSAASDQDLTRLMDKAGVQMDDPANTQRETYSHLRAAVAATEAERKDQPEADDEEEEYRNLTSSVVSPRRPEVQVTSMRPQSDTLAPLKLVAEQRIDNHDEDASPVTPRRVTSEGEDQASEEGGFASFAQEQGAQSLPDLLEAAAAYLSFIEGQEQFSRPQLMNKIRSLKQDEFNREESLRSFGQLLRDGKIEKAGGGRFAASNQIGFRPNDERAAG
ncbi:hypothetical protein RUESEDTHA_00252 [Ruegeria sp. THAF57]|uniref:hypothetical protein n=1 Tax=Ruegeria sp. THAF57 TaxID=2744555 RepID=UPI0015DFACD5|nr:hypothetical protein [Ruegeria sp. THAF57]CAD0183387.1 hypothetical protein RUESEDTHA_00252 [Ruegeria sp. THAF57]